MLTTLKTLTKEEKRTEVIAGITSFFAISYILIVNPLILADAKIPANLSIFATIFASGDLEYQGYTDETAETDRYHEE